MTWRAVQIPVCGATADPMNCAAYCWVIKIACQFRVLVGFPSCCPWYCRAWPLGNGVPGISPPANAVASAPRPPGSFPSRYFFSEIVDRLRVGETCRCSYGPAPGFAATAPSYAEAAREGFFSGGGNDQIRPSHGQYREIVSGIAIVVASFSLLCRPPPGNFIGKNRSDRWSWFTTVADRGAMAPEVLQKIKRAPWIPTTDDRTYANAAL